jgi:hypothetical protein
VSNLERYLHFANKWLDLDQHQKAGNDGKAIRATMNTCWFLLGDEQSKVEQKMRPEALFKGYQP